MTVTEIDSYELFSDLEKQEDVQEHVSIWVSVYFVQSRVYFLLLLSFITFDSFELFDILLTMEDFEFEFVVLAEVSLFRYGTKKVSD